MSTITKKELVIKNIEDAGFEAGRSIKGKGLEVFTKHTLAYTTKYHTKDKLFSHDEMCYLKELHKRYDLSKHVYLLDSQIADRTYREFDENWLELDEVLSAQKFSLYEKPRLLCHLPLSKYDTDRCDQIKLVNDVLEFNDEVYGELDEYCDIDKCIIFNNSHDNTYYKDDYELLHGECTAYEKDDCEYIDGRLSHHNSSVVDDLWSFRMYEDDFFSYIDPMNQLAVYHRKGKDFYIGYSLEEISIIINFIDEDNELTEEEFYYLRQRPNKELLQSAKEHLESLKKDTELRSYVSNELEIGELDSNFDYNDRVFNLGILKLVFDDLYEARNYVEENVDFTKEPYVACQEVNAKIVREFTSIEDDYTIKVTSMPNYYSCSSEEILSFKSLKVIKRLENRLGYNLVYSRIPNTNQLSFAIKVENEEYHFDLGDLIKVDEDINPIEFVQSCLNAIAKRKIDKLSQKELLEKAQTLFISFTYSIQSGNCQLGTQAFCNRHNIDTKKIGAIRGDYLLELENSSFTKRIINSKLVQKGA